MDIIIRTSYFYQVRHFKQYMLPISTAVYDPKWFQGGADGKAYKDRRGIWNGVRCPLLSPAMVDSTQCQLKAGCTPDSCSFLKNYKAYLNSLDFSVVEQYLSRLAARFAEIEKLSVTPHLVLLVHEAPSNLCSERASLQEYFSSHGYPCTEVAYPIL